MVTNPKLIRCQEILTLRCTFRHADDRHDSVSDMIDTDSTGITLQVLQRQLMLQ